MTASPDAIDRAATERRLRDRRRQLRGEIRETLLRIDAERYTSIAGQLAESHEQSLTGLLAEVGQADVARDVQEVQDIEAALGRLEAGTYGQCVECGSVIPVARLDAYPTAKRCLPCQQKHEASRAR
jgi:DnaK suppressor protein